MSSGKASNMYKKVLEVFCQSKDFQVVADVAKLLKQGDTEWVIETSHFITDEDKVLANQIATEFKNMAMTNKVILTGIYDGLLRDQYKSKRGCWSGPVSFSALITAALARKVYYSYEAEKNDAGPLLITLGRLAFVKLITSEELEMMKDRVKAFIKPPVTIEMLTNPEAIMKALPGTHTTVGNPSSTEELELGSPTMQHLIANMKNILSVPPGWVSAEQQAILDHIKVAMLSCSSRAEFDTLVLTELAKGDMALVSGQLEPKEPSEESDEDMDEGEDEEIEEVDKDDQPAGGAGNGGGDHDNGNGDDNGHNLPIMQPRRRRHSTVSTLWNLREHAKFDIMQKGPIVHDYKYDIADVIYFMNQNNLDVKEIRDIVYAALVVKLTSVGLSTITSDDMVPPLRHNTDVGFVTQRKLNSIEPLAKTMAVVALHAYSQGSNDDVIPWYSSFCSVKGTFLSESRFTIVTKMIIFSHQFSEILDMVTVSDVLSANNVFKYRLSRLSTPGLVKKALDLMPFEIIYEKFSPAEVKEYARFEKAGLVAQVASGPLSVYCKGEYDPYDPDHIPTNLPLSDLKAISKAPYFPNTIKKAKIILDTMQFDYGRWFQGEKSARSMEAEDYMFNSLVKSVAKSMKEKASEASPEMEVFQNYDRITKTREAREVLEVVKRWI